MKTIGQKIRELRGNGSLQDMADLTGISVSHMSGMENGRTQSMETLRSISNAHGVSVTELLRGTKYDVPSGRIALLEERVLELETYIYGVENSKPPAPNR